MNASFFHDHYFYEFDGDYYSPGKFGYTLFLDYLRYCDSLKVFGRYKVATKKLVNDFEISTGESVTVHPLVNVSSIKNLYKRKSVFDEILRLTKNDDFYIVRLPSEIGLLAIEVAEQINKPYIIEMVACPYDCLMNRGDFKAKLYAPLLEKRIRKAILKSSHVIYVTEFFFQIRYPSHNKTLACSDVVIEEIKQPKKHTVKNEFIIGVIGSPDSDIKGIELAASTIYSLAEKGIPCKLEVVGGYTNITSKKYDKYKPSVDLKGVISEKQQLFKWLDSLDLYIQPSNAEGLSRSIIEAMSRGIPVISTDVGGNIELTHKNALFAKGSKVQFESLIRRSIFDTKYYESLSVHSAHKSKKYLRDDLEVKRNNFFLEFLDQQLRKNS